MRAVLTLILALALATPVSAHGTVSRTHHERKTQYEAVPRNLFDDLFNSRRLHHRRPLRTERPSPAYGADLPVLSSLSHQRQSRQYLQSATVLAKRPVRRREVMHNARPPASNNSQPRQAQSPAGAEETPMWLVRKVCIDTLDNDWQEFMREIASMNNLKGL